MALKKSIEKWRKRTRHRRRRALDFALLSFVAPMASAAAFGWGIVALSNGERPRLLRKPTIGKGGKVFSSYRFARPKALTRLGWFAEMLDRVHAVETPILLNILKGEMGFVGLEARNLSRPVASIEKDAWRHEARPGLMDTFRLYRRMNMMHEKRETLERKDIEQRGLRHDISILIKTPPALFLGGNTTSRPHAFSLLDIEIDNISMREAIRRIFILSEQRQSIIAFVNAHCLNVSRGDESYRNILSSMAELILPDGIGVKLGARFVGVEVQENVNGTDLFPLLAEASAKHRKSMYLLGAREGIAEKVAKTMQAAHPKLQIVGVHHGHFEFGSAQEKGIIESINQAAPDFLLVAMGVPRQEKWIAENIKALDVGAAIGVGGLFDFYSNRIERAPKWMRENGLEWVFRLMQEPRRLAKRYLIGNPLFLFNVWRWSSYRIQREILRRFDDIDSPLHRLRIELPFHSRRFFWDAAYYGSVAMKRWIDILGSSVGLLLLSPIFLATALAIKLEDSRGPVFYSQARVGLRGELFQLYKFRSMFQNADEMKEKLLEQNEMVGGVLFKIKNDPRITRVGRFIRRYSIDEMPQLLNVLKGDMSIVGPRPPLPREVGEYRVIDRDRLVVKPGLTCLWQVSGRSLLDFQTQVELDREYIRTHNIVDDIKLIFRTVPVVLTGYGSF